MDPNETLKLLRGYATALGSEDLTGDQFDDTALAMAEAMQALDEWLSKGGFLPEDWSGQSN